MASFSLMAWTLSNLTWLLVPLLKPPMAFLSSLLSLKWVLKAVAKLFNSVSSSFLTSVKATQVAFFWWTNLPKSALPLTKQYGMFIFLQRAGSQITNSIGSTLLAITTSLAFLYSTSLVTWFKPNFKWNGLTFSTVFSKVKNKFTFSLKLGFLGKSLLLLLVVLRWVLLQKLEEDFSLISFQGSGELSDGRWNFQSGEENSFLSLEGDVFGPFDESGQVSGRLDVVTESEVSWPLFEERVWFLFDFLDGSFSLGSFTHVNWMIIEDYKKLWII